MTDLFNTTILCDNCNKVTQKIIIDKDNFKIRAAKCNDCNKTWYHPTDIKEYEIYTIKGIVVAKGGNTSIINVSELNNGTYFIVCNSSWAENFCNLCGRWGAG